MDQNLLNTPKTALIGVIPSSAMDRLDGELETAEEAEDVTEFVPALRRAKLWWARPGHRLGSWRDGPGGILIPDPAGDYSGVLVGETFDDDCLLVVLSSRYRTLAAEAAPPFQGMADLLTKGPWYAFAPPPELFHDPRYPQHEDWRPRSSR